ncbi:hypothetical protein GCM10007989_19580 [Devosia pacifica]|uniref:Co-chaperone DjlA N-terminal domain-containing protein n=1 Tax=Devosia pacifica TaxID=1335967 RepID=A0A918S4E6_9HYPH|nr:TerB family tellurite resistance protein [Devosia pacifica]GHA24015.1 hypothetical protein GCM10007989_19580 [Devosia pacifica]
MFEALSRLFAKPEPELDEHDPKLAVAALLIHLAGVDGETQPEERRAIREALMDNYALDQEAVDSLMQEASERDAEAVDFYGFTSALSRLDLAERLEIIEMMWRIVFTDDKNHEMEDNMVWRVAELIGISSRDRTVLRSRIAREKHAG